MKPLVLIGVMLVLPAMAAEPATAPASAATPDAAQDLEPAVKTSPAAAVSPPVTARKSPAAAGAAPRAAAAPVKGASRAQDRLELDTTQITGNSELPRVLYVVPWKRSDLGDLAGRPANSLLDEVLAPVDRDVFRRQNRYYNALKPDAAPRSSGAAAEGEK